MLAHITNSDTLNYYDNIYISIPLYKTEIIIHWVQKSGEIYISSIFLTLKEKLTFSFCSHISQQKPAWIFLSKMSFFMFPSLGKIDRQLYVATTGKYWALVSLSCLTLPFVICGISSLSLTIESLPSNWAMYDNLRFSLSVLGEGVIGGFEGREGTPV